MKDLISQKKKYKEQRQNRIKNYNYKNMAEYD